MYELYELYEQESRIKYKTKQTNKNWLLYLLFFFFNSAQNVRGRDTTTILSWRTGNQRKQFGDVV